MGKQTEKLSYKQGKNTHGTLKYNGIFIALTAEKEVVEDFEFNGVTSDVLRTTGIDEENHEYEIFWTPKHHLVRNGKFTGSVDSIENGSTAYNFTRPLTCRRTDW